jgi:hypothetical protein
VIFYEYEIHKKEQYKHGDTLPYYFNYDFMFQTGRRLHPQYEQRRMHNTYILKLSPDKIGRQIVIVENNLYVPLQYESFDIKHIGNLGYVSGIIDNQEKLWKVENPVVVTKENLDDHYIPMSFQS